MTDEDIRWIASVAMRYDAIIFTWNLRGGTQVVLFPRFWHGSNQAPILQA